MFECAGEGVEMVADIPDSVEPWTAKRRAALIVSVLKGETSVAEAARKHALTVAEVEEWRDRFLVGAENALRSRPKDEDILRDEQIEKLRQKVGELVLDNDILKEALKGGPFDAVIVLLRRGRGEREDPAVEVPAE